MTQDATGTLVMLELEAMGLDRVRTEVSVQYIDHNLIQEDYKNGNDHLFLRSACRKFGVWYSRAGNGHGVDDGVGRVIEYHGPNRACLAAMDRHMIANMGAELGATSTVFPSDDEVRRFLRTQGRESDWMELRADPGATYDQHERIDLGALEPSSPRRRSERLRPCFARVAAARSG